MRGTQYDQLPEPQLQDYLYCCTRILTIAVYILTYLEIFGR